MDRRARSIAQLEMAGQKICVKVGQEHLRDAKPVLCGKCQVLIDVTLRIDDGGQPAGRVAHEIGRVRQTIQVGKPSDGVAGPRGCRARPP